MTAEERYEMFELDVQIVNDHREALGLSKFVDLDEDEVATHMKLINDNAPYGDSPWPEEM